MGQKVVRLVNRQADWQLLAVPQRAISGPCTSLNGLYGLNDKQAEPGQLGPLRPAILGCCALTHRTGRKAKEPFVGWSL
jgi:hypothetical protein